MEKNEINIINDLDKENDDLMTHLGILQQLSLGQKTNVLKEIKSYKDDSLNNNKSKNINENKSSKKFEIEQKPDINNENKISENNNKRLFDFIKENNEFDIKEINKENCEELNLPEKSKNSEINSLEKNKINDDYEIFKNNEKLIFNINNKNFKNTNENNNSSEIENINNLNFQTNDTNTKEEESINIISKDNYKFNFLKEEDDIFRKDFHYNDEKNIYDKNYETDINNNKKENKEQNIMNEKLNEEKKSNIKIINQENKNDNFICDLDIFKKLQMQMNKKSEILQKTLDKYNHKPKKFEIINDSKLNQNSISNYSIEQNKINESFKYKNNIDTDSNNINSINSTGGINIDDINEKMNYNTQNLLEKINRIKNNIEKADNINKNKNIKSNNKLNKDKDRFIKNEIKSAQSSYEPLIFRIPSLLLDDKIEEIEIYIKLEMIYYNLKTITSKLDFISLLRQVLNNVIMLKNASFNVYMQLFNFILSLQIYELNLSDCNPSLPCEYLKSLLDLLVNNKDLTEMIRIIIVLIKKYFPINMGIMLEKKNIVTLKVLNSYLNQLNNVILSSYINIKSIFIEINDFLFFSPPSLLSDEFPLAELYMEIYQEIRNTTDNIIKSCRTKIMKNELMNAVVFIKSKIKNSSVDYVKYLDYAIYKIN